MSSFPFSPAPEFEHDRLNRVAFPLGGLGSGMVCLEGNGSFTSFSLRHRPEVYHKALVFSALALKGEPGKAPRARVLEGPVPDWQVVFPWGHEFESSGDGGRGKTCGFPHFESARFHAKFPFGHVALADGAFPIAATLTAWNPFIPNAADDSSLPVAGLEYHFTNTSTTAVEAVYSFHAQHFLALAPTLEGARVRRMQGGFVLEQTAPEDRPWEAGAFAAWIDAPDVNVNPTWFRGGWFDSATLVWKTVAGAECLDLPEAEGLPSRGGSLYLPLRLKPGETQTVVLKWAWHVPFSNLEWESGSGATYRPWYARAFPKIADLTTYWRERYGTLRSQTEAFTEAFYDSTLPPEVLEAVGANLSILKSPTLLRQEDGRLWAWEGCHDDSGSCPGTCTHVWNYAQALPHLFPDLERGLRETEFFDSQNATGHQRFRAALPIGPGTNHDFYPAADGQLGGIIKVYRDWHISGDAAWLAKMWPQVRQSLDYCIEAWDPEHRGVPAEPHHNTYDIEFWGEEGMCGSIYLGALAAAMEMGEATGSPVPLYRELLQAGRAFLEERLFNGEYFEQHIRWTGLRAKDPTQTSGLAGSGVFSPEALELLQKEGPRYQYGKGCLADGVIGAWMGWAAGLPPFMDGEKVRRHAAAVFKYNFKENLSAHANPQRSGYALGREAGLLLCTWPHGERLSLPLPYSEEVWTGIEYQVAAHLISLGMPGEGLRIVRAVRARYDGRVRNPFGEYECGHWYARAMASYSLLQALSGARYDAVEKTLHLAPRLEGDFRSFLCTATGFGTVGVREGKPFLEVKAGRIDVERIDYRPAA